MSQPTSAVSLRITEEDLALLDAQVGLKGSRNRSDVVRMAIQEYLHNRPKLLQDMEIRANPDGPPRPTATWETVRVARRHARTRRPRRNLNLYIAEGHDSDLGADQQQHSMQRWRQVQSSNDSRRSEYQE